MAEKLQSAEIRDVQLNFRIPTGLPSRTAQHMFVQDTGDFIQLSFFEIVYPVFSPKRMQEEIEAIQASGLLAECVSKINVPKAKFKDFVKAMSLVFDDEVEPAKVENAES